MYMVEAIIYTVIAPTTKYMENTVSMNRDHLHRLDVFF